MATIGDPNATHDQTLYGTVRGSAYGGHGNDVVYGSWTETIITGAGDDEVFGSSLNQTIDTGDGNDRASSKGGDDTITTGSGDDWVNGGPGNDTIDTGVGSDVIEAFAGQGNDTVHDFDAAKDNLSLTFFRRNWLPCRTSVVHGLPCWRTE